MEQISSVSLERFSNGAHFVMMGDVLKHAEADPKIKQKVGNLIDDLKTAFAQEDEALRISQKNLKTDDIAAADALRDNIYRGYKKAVKAYLSFPLPEQAGHAKVLWQHMADYKIDPTMQLDKETGMLINFIDDLEKKHSAAVSALNLTAFVTQLKQANEQVRTLTGERTDERSTIVVGALRQARTSVDEAYRKLIQMVNALALVENDSAYLPFIQFMNQEIKQMKQNALGQSVSGKTRAAKPGKASASDSASSTSSGTPASTPGGSDQV